MYDKFCVCLYLRAWEIVAVTLFSTPRRGWRNARKIADLFLGRICHRLLRSRGCDFFFTMENEFCLSARARALESTFANVRGLPFFARGFGR